MITGRIPIVNYPVSDRSNQRLNFAKTSEDDTLDIGWAEGTLNDGRPYRADRGTSL
jgi:hypothetical protein